MMPLLFDPLDPPPDAWPVQGSDARPYIEGIARAGVTAMVGNVRTRWRVLRSGDRVLPVTINDGETGDSYVCLPHSAYILYARQELDLVDTGLLAPLFRLLIGLADGLLRAAGINRIVHVDNWLLSTNLHGSWRGDDIPAIRRTLTAHFPDHILAIRSLDAWSCPDLLAAARNDGWHCLPSRQIWVTDDPERQWRRTKDARRDRRLIDKGGYVVDGFAALSDDDAVRIAALYRLLYVDKYSPLNPVFAPAYIRMTHRQGFIRYRGLRDRSGQLVAVAGLLVRGDLLTTPIVGYDTRRPQREGLYRIACYMINEEAAGAGLRLNGSAGAGGFKRNRGAAGEIEYSAMFIGHLSLFRRLVITLLAMVLTRLAVPMMKRRGL